MVLNDCKTQLDIKPAESNDLVDSDPATLNTWLQQNNGFEDIYGFKWNATAPIGLVFEKFSQNKTELFQAYDAGKRIFLHVRNNNHYVLMTGYYSEGTN